MYTLYTSIENCIFFLQIRLLNYVECVKEKVPISVWTTDVVSASPYPRAHEVMELLTKVFDVGCSWQSSSKL